MHPDPRAPEALNYPGPFDKDQPPFDPERHIRTELCRFCRKPYKMTELLDHEAKCPDAVECPFCGIELAKTDYDFHLARCPEVAMCRFCGNQYPMRDIEPHEVQCPDRAECKFCGLLMPKQLLEHHIIRNCPKAKPGVNQGDDDVDPRPYQDMLEKNASRLKRKSLNGKVIIEDDFVKPNDFRDPGNRKKNNESGASQSRANSKFRSSGKDGSQDRGSL